MRVTPTLTFSSAAHFRLTDASFNQTVTNSITASTSSQRRARVNVSVATTPLVAGNAVYWSSDSASSTIDASAEL